MKIISPFVDYYDKASNKNISLVYNRVTSVEYDAQEVYRNALAVSEIGHGVTNRYDLNINPSINKISRDAYTAAVPKLAGIAGKIYLFVDYKNSLLNIKRRFFNFSNLKAMCNSTLIERNFKMFDAGLLKGYCYDQFKCVNFLMYFENDELIIIREPSLFDYGLYGFLTPIECYNNIDLFLKNKSTNNKIYKNILKNKPNAV